MKVPWEDKLPCAALALLVLAVFYGTYFAKMLAQKRRGIQTRQIGRRREKDIWHTFREPPEGVRRQETKCG